MDRSAAMLILLGVLVSAVLLLLAFFAVAPIMCTCLVAILYTLYLFMAYEEWTLHHAQEFENRYWTVFGLLISTALFFAKDSPIAFGLWSPSLGFLGVVVSAYAMHLWDRYAHRIAISQQTNLRRAATANTSLLHLRDLGIPVEAQLERINECLQDIDQLLIPSTINNFINQRFILQKEREIITIFEECDARALNYLIGHVKLGLLFYKVKDHRNFHGKHRTELISLLAVDRLPILTVISRVIILHGLQLLKLRANPRAEYWVRNILLNTHQDELSELKTLTDSKGDYFCMNKLLWDDIRSESVRQDILNHLRREAALQQTHSQARNRRQRRFNMQWRKVLSDVDDTLYCSGGSYPAGIDKRYPKKTVYPGVLAFYRELDLGTDGPEEWPDDRVGNLVFLSARPHVYKDLSEKANFAKFEKLRSRNDGRKGMHTTPSLLAGDLKSGGKYMFSNDFEPLARKKFDNFKRYVSIYPEYKHVFVCDNGQGDVRAGEMMFDSFPYEFEALYVHIVQDIPRTHGYAPRRWSDKEFRPVFFKTYVDAALHAASQHPPLIRVKGLQRICLDSVKDFAQIKPWPAESLKALRRQELNQDIWRANSFLQWHGEESVRLIQADRRFSNGEKVRTPFGIGTVIGFDSEWDLYELELDWRPSDVQVLEYIEDVKKGAIRPKATAPQVRNPKLLETVIEADEADEDVHSSFAISPDNADVESGISLTTDNLTNGQTQEVGQSSAETRLPHTSRAEPMPERALAALELPEPSLTHESENSLSSVSESDVSPTPLLVPDPEAIKQCTYRVAAKISGRNVTPFTPPVLPKLPPPKTPTAIEKQKGSLFNFLQAGGDLTPKKVTFKAGDQVKTRYGVGVVVEHQQERGFVVVEFANWHATGYLRDSEVKKAPKSLLESLIRQLSTSEKPPEFPHLEGTVIDTPYGRAKVTRPVPVARANASSSVAKRASKTKPETMGLSLESWTLANGSHPMLYCTVESARAWKDQKEAVRRDGSGSILTKIVTSSRTLLEPFLSQKPPVKEDPPKLVARYYEDAAAVSTSFGYGFVKGFRPSSGMYEVSLSQWGLADGSHPTAYLRKEDLSHRVAKNCQEGYPVLTSLGLSGTLASVVPTTGVHIVTIPSCGMVCYLRADDVVRPLKAAVGEEVLTAYGEGRVERYNATQDTYAIKLHGWGATLFAKGDTFERVNEGVQDRDGVFGVKWLLSFLFNVETQHQGPHRSRSNSLVSTQSHSNRSNS